MATWVPENEPPNSSPLCAAYYSSIQQNDRALAASGASAPPQLGLGPAPAPRGEEDKAATGVSAGSAAAAPAAAPKGTGVVSASEPALSAVQQAKLAALVA